MWWDELNDADYRPATATDHPAGPPKLYYNSITSRRPIINAITGEFYYHHILDSTGCRSSHRLERNKKIPYRMGSRDEGRFYVVIMGEPSNPKESCKVFFDSPEEYERFSGIEVCAQSKNAFKERKQAFDMVNCNELRAFDDDSDFMI